MYVREATLDSETKRKRHERHDDNEIKKEIKWATSTTSIPNHDDDDDHDDDYEVISSREPNKRY